MWRITRACGHRGRERASVFVTELHPAADAAAREAVLGRIRKRDFDATHHCSAWRDSAGGHGADDDGEPSGTAGGPMLRVLEGEDLVEVLAVCSRWFGGTKLGTGGLVRAYTEGVQGAVAEARALGLLEEVRRWSLGTIRVPAGQAHLPFAALGGVKDLAFLGQRFEGTEAAIAFRVPEGEEAALEALWRDRSRGGGILWGAFADPAPPFADPS